MQFGVGPSEAGVRAEEEFSTWTDFPPFFKNSERLEEPSGL